MRVAHVLRKLNPAEWGGTESAVQGLVGGLQQHGVEPVIYCPRLEQTATLDPLVESGHLVRRFNAFVPVLGLSRQERRELVALGGNLMSLDLLSLLWREPDLAVMHTHTLGRIGGVALTIAKQRRIPFVVTIHGGVLDLPDTIKKEFNAPGMRGWEWGKLFGLLFQSHRLFCDADAIVTCNSKEAALLQAQFPAKRIVVQPHGVPVELYRQDQRSIARETFPAIRGRKIILCVGRIDPVKNQQWLLEQAPRFLSRHPATMLVLAGPVTHEAYGQELERRIKGSAFANRMLLIGGLPPGDARLIGLFQEASVVVLPSVSETFGLVILEAWAAGTPVLSNRTSGAVALARGNDDGWLFDLNAPPGFHLALDQVLTDAKIAGRWAANGAVQVNREHSITALAGRMKSLYAELIAGAARGKPRRPAKPKTEQELQRHLAE